MRPRKPKRPPSPPEDVEQRKLAQWLDWNGVCWTHVPNGGQRHPAVAAKLKACGVKRGVPDVLIFDAAAFGCVETPCGIAIELKRADGVQSDVSLEQRQWLDMLSKRGWRVLVCFGADQAIDALKGLGIGKTTSRQRDNRGDTNG